MKALLVIDVQNGIVNHGEFQQELSLIEHLIRDFKDNGRPVIFLQHFDTMEESPLHRSSEGSELHPSVKEYAQCVVEKQTPDSFYQTELAATLEKLGVQHVFITGFETEFCCMFTAIAAFDRGYQVTFLKNATGSLNNGETYQMEGLEIRNLVGKILAWSGTVEVIDYAGYVEKYKQS